MARGYNWWGNGITAFEGVPVTYDSRIQIRFRTHHQSEGALFSTATHGSDTWEHTMIGARIMSGGTIVEIKQQGYEAWAEIEVGKWYDLDFSLVNDIFSLNGEEWEIYGDIYGPSIGFESRIGALSYLRGPHVVLSKECPLIYTDVENVKIWLHGNDYPNEDAQYYYNFIASCPEKAEEGLDNKEGRLLNTVDGLYRAKFTLTNGEVCYKRFES